MRRRGEDGDEFGKAVTFATIKKTGLDRFFWQGAIDKYRISIDIADPFAARA